jgi:hypothetical protein
LVYEDEIQSFVNDVLCISVYDVFLDDVIESSPRLLICEALPTRRLVKWENLCCLGRADSQQEKSTNHVKNITSDHVRVSC